ncbi:hypothetical protein HMPREF0972_02237 [Actinomyces sp. oral taxon 848 str. F0332]|nr:hypothetical protein HMPREF0972_02237 [Actinomyces sp. oral taxon 848 str. F0332]
MAASPHRKGNSVKGTYTHGEPWFAGVKADAAWHRPASASKPSIGYPRRREPGYPCLRE